MICRSRSPNPNTNDLGALYTESPDYVTSESSNDERIVKAKFEDRDGNIFARARKEIDAFNLIALAFQKTFRLPRQKTPQDFAP